MAAHTRYPSWRQRLNWVQGVVSAADFTGSPEQLASLAIYLRFLATGEVSCEEDGRHFRPHHHAGAALAIEDRLEAVTSPQDRWILRKIHPWLPSYSTEFRRSEPLTRIRDIAHRNDIPKELKGEIKHRLQNKLHRCAGPEDLKTSRELLERITASGADYSPEFVKQFSIFHQELSEFFNASALDQRLEGLLPSLPPGDASQIRSFLLLKARRGGSDAELLELLAQLTALRESVSQRIPEAEGEQAQRLRLADISLEDYAFALLSEAANHLDSQGWSSLLAALAIAVANVKIGNLEAAECMAVMSELQAWTPGFDPTQRFHLLRLKATLERARRITDSYSDRVLNLFPPRVIALGRAMGVAEHAISLFCEGDIRGNVIFQLAKLVETAQRDINTALNLSPWATLVPGEASGRLLRCTTLETLPPRDHHSVIVLLDRAEGDEEIPANVRGILLGHPIPHLSHLGVRARQTGVPFATCEHRQSLVELEPYLNSPVQLRIKGDDVVIGPAAPNTDVRVPMQRKEKLLVPTVELCQESHTVPLREATVARCGAKAAAAGRLLTLAEKSAGLFRAPQGLVLPFGAMQCSLAQQELKQKEYLAHQAHLQQASPEDLDGTLKGFRDILLALPISAEVCEEIRLFFGVRARLAVRSSANGEDLEELASAGLYDSCIGVSVTDSADAIRQVWASLWTRRAVLSRDQNRIPHSDIHMAVLIQEVVAPKLSFIMHTLDHISGDRNQAWVELALGLGETLASAGQSGTPYRMRCNRDTGEAALSACASYSWALQPASRKGLKHERVDYSTEALSADPSTAAVLGRRLAEIAEFLELEIGAPQDVEGVITGEDIYIVQIRPQQGIVSPIY